MMEEIMMSWILEFEDFFRFFQLNEVVKLKATIIALDGEVQRWSGEEHRQQPFDKWNQLKDRVKEHFTGVLNVEERSINLTKSSYKAAKQAMVEVQWALAKMSRVWPIEASPNVGGETLVEETKEIQNTTPNFQEELEEERHQLMFEEEESDLKDLGVHHTSESRPDLFGRQFGGRPVDLRMVLPAVVE